MKEVKTVGDALRWVNKLKQMNSEGTQVIMVRYLLEGEREACAEVALAAMAAMAAATIGKGGAHSRGFREACATIAVAIRARGLR